MKKRTGTAVFVAATCVAALLAAAPIWAEDEELDSTVYMVFDPETGELVMVEEPSGVRNTHDPTDAFAAGDTRDETSGSHQSLPTTVLLGGFFVLGFFAGALVWFRKGKKSA